MKKLTLILLILICGISSSQILPKEFKIAADVIKSLKPANELSNKFQQNVIFTPTPVSSSTIISNFISDIIVVDNPLGDTIWFGTGKGLSRTINRGQSFQNYYGTDPFGEDDVSGIAVYRNWIVVSTAYTQVINEENVPTGSGIKVSSDYGVTWKKYPQPRDTQADTVIEYGSNHIKVPKPTVVVEFNLSYDILITRKNLTSDSIVIWIASWAGGVRKSTNFGETFKRVLLPPDNLSSITPDSTYNFIVDVVANGNHKGFSLAALNDSTIFAGTSGGINKSTDWGLSWRKYRYGTTGGGQGTTGISGNFVVGLDVQRYGTNEILWAATNPGEAEPQNTPMFSAISYTTNAGLNWANTLDIEAFSHGVGFKDSIVYAATDNGIWRSYFKPPNFGWSKPSIIYDEQIRDQINTNFFYAVSGQGDSVWVGSGDGLARTTDIQLSPWVGKWKIFRAYKDFASVNETYAAPNPFSPDDEVCRIYFRTGKASQSSITIKLFDFAMFPVRTIIQNASRSTQDIIWVTWDGKRDDGMQVSNGVYFYRIQIDKDEVVWGKILVMQ